MTTWTVGGDEKPNRLIDGHEIHEQDMQRPGTGNTKAWNATIER